MQRRWVLLCAAIDVVVILLVALVYGYPVGGVVWNESQVHRLAQVAGPNRAESESRVAIRETLAAARWGRFKTLWAGDCPSREMELLTENGWVPVTVTCPGGFFLDCLPPPVSR